MTATIQCRNGTYEELKRTMADLMTLQAPLPPTEGKRMMQICAELQMVSVCIECAYPGFRRKAAIDAGGRLSDNHYKILKRIVAWFDPSGRRSDEYLPRLLTFEPREAAASGHETLEASDRLVEFLVARGLKQSKAEVLVRGGIR